MNCIEARRLMLQTPKSGSDDFYSHITNCETCHKEYLRILSFEATFADAIKAEPPISLKEKILLRGHFQAERQQRKRIAFAALAASLLLVVGISLNSGLVYNDPISNTVLSHIEDERHHLREVKPIDDAKMNLLLASLDGHYENQQLRINYAGRCQIRKQQGLHMVVQGELGPVTVLIMPGEFRDNELSISNQRFQGKVYATNYGSFAVVGEKDENIKPIAHQVRNSVSIEI